MTQLRILHVVSSVSPRRYYILFSTRNPPSVQRIPWPVTDESDLHDDGGYGYESWTLSDHSDHFQWLVDTNGQSCAYNSPVFPFTIIISVAVSNISSLRGTDVESWITSDGRAYLVQLMESHETASHSEGTETDDAVCFSNGHAYHDCAYT